MWPESAHPPFGGTDRPKRGWRSTATGDAARTVRRGLAHPHAAAITRTGGRIPAARDDIHLGERLRASPTTQLETLTTSADRRLPGTRGRWLLLGPFLPLRGLSGAARGGAGGLVGGRQMALQHPARGRRIRLPGLPQPAREGASGLALSRSHAAAVGRRRLLLHALPPRLDGRPTDGDGLALARLLSRPLRGDRPARARTNAALRAEPLARRGARRTRRRRCRRSGAVRSGRREHGRLAADRRDEPCVPACGRAAARPGRRRPGDHRLAARPGLAVHSRRHGCAGAGGQRRPLPGGGRLDRQHPAARCRLAARDAPPRGRRLAARRPARRRSRRGSARARAAGGLRPESRSESSSTASSSR